MNCLKFWSITKGKLVILLRTVTNAVEKPQIWIKVAMQILRIKTAEIVELRDEKCRLLLLIFWLQLHESCEVTYIDIQL